MVYKVSCSRIYNIFSYTVLGINVDAIRLLQNEIHNVIPGKQRSKNQRGPQSLKRMVLVKTRLSNNVKKKWLIVGKIATSWCTWGHIIMIFLDIFHKFDYSGFGLRGLHVVTTIYLVLRINQHLWFFTALQNGGEFTEGLLSYCKMKLSDLFL